MGRSQREKGKRIERLGCALLRSLGFEARRSVQFCGRSETSADLVHNVPGVRLELKGGYGSAHLGGSVVSDWMTKLKAESAEGERPVVLWKPDRRPWLAIMEVGGMLVATADVAAALKYGGA